MNQVVVSVAVIVVSVELCQSALQPFHLSRVSRDACWLGVDRQTMHHAMQTLPSLQADHSSFPCLPCCHRHRPLDHQLPRRPADPSLCWSEATVGRMGTSVGPPPPPPRRGLAMRLPAPAKLKPIGEPRPRVLPALACSRRSLTAESWASNLLPQKNSLVSKTKKLDTKARSSGQAQTCDSHS